MIDASLVARLPSRRGRRYVARDAALDGLYRPAVVVPDHGTAGNLSAYRQIGEGCTYIFQGYPGRGGDFGIQKLSVPFQVFKD
jgi:hypothetical protein